MKTPPKVPEAVAGSAVAADAVSSNAFVATTLSGSVGLSMWALIDLLLRGKPSILAMCSGAVAGLATITPASGSVMPTGAVIIGAVAGVSTYLAWLCSVFSFVVEFSVFSFHSC